MSSYTQVELADIVMDPRVEFWASPRGELFDMIKVHNIAEKGPMVCPMYTENGKLYAVVDFRLSDALFVTSWLEAVRLKFPEDSGFSALREDAEKMVDDAEVRAELNKGWGDCDAILAATEERLQIRFPAALRTIYNEPSNRGKNGWRVHFIAPIELGEIYNMLLPPRFLPFFHGDGNGELFGLYFPRVGGAPWLAEWEYTGGLCEITTDFERFVAAPCTYGDLEGTDSPLQIRPDAAQPELELLKPFCLERGIFRHQEWRGEDPPPADQLGPLVSRFSARDGVAGCIAKAFPEVEQVSKVEAWLKLSEALLNKGAVTEALQALDNGEAVFMLVPNRNVGSNVVKKLRAARAEILQQHPDPFDQAWLEVMGPE